MSETDSEKMGGTDVAPLMKVRHKKKHKKKGNNTPSSSGFYEPGAVIA